MWNPPLVDETLGKRASALGEAAKLLADLVSRDVRTICFLKSRRGVELIQRFARLRLEDMGRVDAAERIAPYRAGYTPTQRREIERRLDRDAITDAVDRGILTEAEAATLRLADQATDRAIRVDDFAPEELVPRQLASRRDEPAVETAAE